MYQQPGLPPSRGSRSRSHERMLQTQLAIPNAVAQMPIQIRGLSPLPTCNALNAIISNNCFIVVQCFEPLEVFTGIETPNRYIIHDGFMRPILFAFERSGHSARQCGPTNHNFTMEILDFYGAVFMTSVRKRWCGDDKLFTQYPPGNTIGEMRMGCCSCSFSVRATGSPEEMYIHPPCCRKTCQNSVFPIVTQMGFPIGEIVRLYPGYLQEQVSDQDTFLVHFPADMPPHLKLVLLSAVFLIDFTYFER